MQYNEITLKEDFELMYENMKVIKITELNEHIFIQVKLNGGIIHLQGRLLSLVEIDIDNLLAVFICTKERFDYLRKRLTKYKQ